MNIIKRLLAVFTMILLVLPAWGAEGNRGVVNNPNAFVIVFNSDGDNSTCLLLTPSFNIAGGLFTAYGFAQGDEGLNVSFVWRCDEAGNLIEPWSFDDSPLPQRTRHRRPTTRIGHTGAFVGRLP